MLKFKYLLSLISVIVFLSSAISVCYKFFSLPNANYFDASFYSLFHPLQKVVNRPLELTINREKEIYIILGNDSGDYAQIKETIDKLKAIDGIFWFYDSNVIPNYLSFYKAESYYRSPQITGVYDRASLLARLEKNLSNLSKEELYASALRDPFAFWYDFEMSPYKGTKDNIIYVNMNDDTCGKARKCYILKGRIDTKEMQEGFKIFASNKSRFDTEFNDALAGFKANGGIVFSFGGAISQGRFIDLLRTEIGLIWLSAVVIIFATFIFIFKSVKPFLGMMFFMVLSFFVGFMATVLVCGSVHLFTLILVAPVISILSDLFLNFIAEQTTKAQRKRAALQFLVIALITYGSLALSGFLIFVEVSVLASVSIVMFFTGIYGFLYWQKPLDPETVFRHIRFMRISNKSKIVRVLSALILLWFVVVAAVGYSRINLFTLKEAKFDTETIKEIMLNNKNLAKILYQGAPISTLIVSADTVQSLAERLSQIDAELASLKKHGFLDAYKTYSNVLIPSVEALKNASFYTTLLDDAREYYIKRGISKEDAQKITIPRFKKVPALQFTQLDTIDFYQEVIDISDKPYLSVISVVGMSEDNIKNLVDKYPYLTYQDFISEYYKAIAQHRNDAIIVLGLLCLTLFVLIFTVRGLNGILGVLFPAILAMGFVLEFMYVMSIDISLYTIVAAVLIIGVSIDGSIVLRQIPKLSDYKMMQPVIFAFIINQGIFGLLAVSDLPNVSDMGLVVLVGLLIAMVSGIILNIFVIPPRKSRPTFFYKLHKKEAKHKNTRATNNQTITQKPNS